MKPAYARNVLVLTLLIFPATVAAGQVSVAVAANFTAPMKLIAEQFQQETGHTATLSFGATGQFYAQISNGAPFDVLLAADTKTPSTLVKNNLGVAGTQFTYALGKLALYSAEPGLVDNQGTVLKTGSFNKLAIANPKLAPYGLAATEVLEALGLSQAVAPKLVEGANIGQAYQYVASGNATLGFVALSQIMQSGQIKSGSAWLVPGTLYSPIKQDAVLLKNGADNPAAQALLKYLQGDAAKAVIESFGYER
jgi:molybdate transport system substrate-binding protein